MTSSKEYVSETIINLAKVVKKNITKRLRKGRDDALWKVHGAFYGIARDEEYFGLIQIVWNDTCALMIHCAGWINLDAELGDSFVLLRGNLLTIRPIGHLMNH